MAASLAENWTLAAQRSTRVTTGTFRVSNQPFRLGPSGESPVGPFERIGRRSQGGFGTGDSDGSKPGTVNRGPVNRGRVGVDPGFPVQVRFVAVSVFPKYQFRLTTELDHRTLTTEPQVPTCLCRDSEEIVYRCLVCPRPGPESNDPAYSNGCSTSVLFAQEVWDG